MSLNSISLKFTDADELNGRVEIILDPPDFDLNSLTLEKLTPSIYLAFECVKFLHENDDAPKDQKGFSTQIH